VKLQGELGRDALPNLLQYLNMSGVTGVLRLGSGGRQGEVFLQGGAVVHASAGGRSGTGALQHLLRLERGTFRFETGTSPPEQSISTPLNALLLELAYETDEEQAGAAPEAALLTPEAILDPVRAADSRHRAGNLTLPVTAIRSLPLLSSGLRISGLADRLGVGVPEMLAAAEVLVRSGLAEVRRQADVDPALITGITALLRDIMGPLAEIVLDEVLFELDLSPEGVPAARLEELLERLTAAAAAERPGVERVFRERLRRLTGRTETGTGN